MTLERISKRFIERHPQDAVRIVEQLADNEKTALITSLSPGSAADILQAMTPADAVVTISPMTPVQSVTILGNVSPNFAAACMRRLPAEKRRSILLEAEKNGSLNTVRTLLNFPPGQAGAVMDPQAPALQEQMTVKEAVACVRRYKEKLQNTIYVVNQENILTGLIEARDLLVLKDNASINTSMKSVQYRLNGRVHLHTAVDNPGWEHQESMPVIDYHGIYLGSLTREALLKALTDIDVDDIHGDQPKEILIGLAETFLNTCSELLFPNRK